MKSRIIFLIVFYFVTLNVNSEPYIPKAEKVTENIYAIIGPLDQRSKQNDGLNNNFGFIVTGDGVILIDSGASKLGAIKIKDAVKAITDKPIRWVINTGSQDHRWLGNDYFSSQKAETIALESTALTQDEFAQRHIDRLQGFLGERLDGTKPMPASRRLSGKGATLNLGGIELRLIYTNTHFPGDSMIWLPKEKVLFSGDLIYVDRLFSVHPWSSVINGQKAFAEVEKLNPVFIVPGHGRVCDLAKARSDSGDYYKFLNEKIGSAATEMEPMDEVLKMYSNIPEFEHLEHYDDLHRKNMSRVFLEYESL